MKSTEHTIRPSTSDYFDVSVMMKCRSDYILQASIIESKITPDR